MGVSSAMRRVGEGRVISLQYRVRLANGQVVEATREAPMDYLHGGGQILPALERALEGLLEGERAAFSIAPEDAYGARDDGNLATLPKGLFPEDAEVKPGVQLLARAASDRPALRARALALGGAGVLSWGWVHGLVAVREWIG